MPAPFGRPFSTEARSGSPQPMWEPGAAQAPPTDGEAAPALDADEREARVAAAAADMVAGVFAQLGLQDLQTAEQAAAMNELAAVNPAEQAEPAAEPAADTEPAAAELAGEATPEQEALPVRTEAEPMPQEAAFDEVPEHADDDGSALVEELSSVAEVPAGSDAEEQAADGLEAPDDASPAAVAPAAEVAGTDVADKQPAVPASPAAVAPAEQAAEAADTEAANGPAEEAAWEPTAAAPAEGAMEAADTEAANGPAEEAAWEPTAAAPAEGAAAAEPAADAGAAEPAELAERASAAEEPAAAAEEADSSPAAELAGEGEEVLIDGGPELAVALETEASTAAGELAVEREAEAAGTLVEGGEWAPAAPEDMAVEASQGEAEEQEEAPPQFASKPLGADLGLAEGERPQSFAMLAAGEEPQSFEMLAAGEERPQSFEMLAAGEERPQSFEMLAAGEERPQSFEMLAAGEEPQSFEMLAAGEPQAAELAAVWEAPLEEGQEAGSLAMEEAAEEGSPASAEVAQEGGSWSAALGCAVPAGLAGGDLAVSGDASAAEAYSQALQREVSVKLLAVLSEQQLQEQWEPAGSGGDSWAGSALCSPGAAASLEAAPKEGSAAALMGSAVHTSVAEAVEPAEFQTPAAPEELYAGPAAAATYGDDAPLLKWTPAPKKAASMHVRKLAGPTPASASPAVLAGAAVAAAGSPVLGSPPVRSGGPNSPTHRQRMAQLPARSPAAVAGAGGPAPAALSPTHAGRMAPLTRTASTGSRGAGARPRRLSKPSMNEILGAAGATPGLLRRHHSGNSGTKFLMTAPPPASLMPGGVPMQLRGAGTPGAAFPAMGDAAPGSLLHWGKPAAQLAPIGAPAGWMAPVPQPGMSYMVPAGMAMAPPGVFMTGPYAQATQMGAPAGTGYEPAGGDQGAAEQEGAADGSEAPANGGAEGEGEGQPAEDQEHPHSVDCSPGKEGSEGSAYQHKLQQQEQYDVAASWPPYEGAKLPPLHHMDQVNGAGLIPAVHSGTSFSVAPNRRGQGLAHLRAPSLTGPASWRAGGPQGGYPPQAQQQQQMAAAAFWAAPRAGMPPAQYVAAQQQMWGYGPPLGAAPQGAQQAQQVYAEQQAALQYQQQAAADAQMQMYQQQQQQQYYQQQQYQGQYEEQYPEQYGSDGAGEMHGDGPVFYREPPPPLPVAIDARGRPFKVFHGVAARTLRRPERYQGDGRPTWSK